MNPRVALIIGAVAAAIFGLLLALAPATMLSGFGLRAPDEAVVLSRDVGVTTPMAATAFTPNGTGLREGAAETAFPSSEGEAPRPASAPATAGTPSRAARASVDGAEAAWRRCVERRHAQASANLAFLLHEFQSRP